MLARFLRRMHLLRPMPTEILDSKVFVNVAHGTVSVKLHLRMVFGDLVINVERALHGIL
jgi:hypothetical protein